MYELAVSGNDDNNQKFSICSRNNILDVLQTPTRVWCFKPLEVVFCGNYVVSVMLSYNSYAA